MKEHPIYNNYIVYEDGKIFNRITNKFLKQRTNEFGYVSVTVRETLTSKWKWVKVHRLVAQTYIPNPENKPEVNHIDCNKNNNSVINLEWVTSLENKIHARENNLYKDYGENAHNATLTNQQVEKICGCLQDGMRNKDVADMFNIHKDVVAHIKAGDIWKSISSKYNFSIKRNKRKSIDTIKLVCEKIVGGLRDKEISDITFLDVRDVNRIRRKVIHKVISDSYF